MDEPSTGDAVVQVPSPSRRALLDLILVHELIARPAQLVLPFIKEVARALEVGSVVLPDVFSDLVNLG